MAARRAQQARASHLASSSNLASGAYASSGNGGKQSTSARVKSTSMTNLVIGGGGNSNSSHQAASRTSTIQRPASRSALDSIHKGMNAKFTHVQSKVLLQNIRPQAGANASRAPAGGARSSSPAAAQQSGSSGTPVARGERLFPANSSTLRGRAGAHTPTSIGSGGGGATGANKSSVQSDRSQLINRIKALQDEVEARERERDDLKRELERERADRNEQLATLKGELEAKALESERQHEEYHQKLIEAYELADQNRRAADNVLGESRQREEELRKKIEELEQQLGELREFVAMKEEMMGKMGELREQIRIERERYEEKTRSLNQMFENEKISHNHQVDQNSNYFRRQKPCLQSVESINRLDGGAETIEPLNPSDYSNHQNQNHHHHHHHNDYHQHQQQQLTQEQVEKPLTKQQKPCRHHKSEHDIYGSKLSTRMQDGARAAWKKSRKFASSVITGSFGGLSACRRHNISGGGGSSKKQGAGSSAAGTSQQAQVATTMLHVNALPPEQQHYRSCSPSQLDSMHHHHHQQQEHTSVVEVGATVREFISSRQQQQQQQVVTVAPSAAIINQQQQPQEAAAAAAAAASPSVVQQADDDDIRIDANNKLTIVTKFNELVTGASGGATSGPHHANGATSSASSERSRCESSSSGRGTSDSGSAAGSQHGEGDQQQHLENSSATFHGQKHRRGSSSLVFNATSLEDSNISSTNPTNQTTATSGNLNKSLKSFFALAASSMTAAAAAAANSEENSNNQQTSDEPPCLANNKQQDVAPGAKANELAAHLQFVHYEGDARRATTNLRADGQICQPGQVDDGQDASKQQQQIKMQNGHGRHTDASLDKTLESTMVASSAVAVDH